MIKYKPIQAASWEGAVRSHDIPLEQTASGFSCISHISLSHSSYSGIYTSRFRSRKKRTFCINNPGHAHELTFSCYRNRPFLSNRQYCLHLCEAISAARQQYLFHVWRYVFMPNHVHLLIYPKLESYDMAEILQSAVGQDPCDPAIL